ncbi:MAG: hypothetical protein GY810_13225 [Aureispira sp.]|nr:hypothetical protein [Aureispira sp.]
MHLPKILFLFLTMLFISQNLYAQDPDLIDDKDTISVLVFQHADKQLTKLIREGGRVRYQLRKTKRTIKGVLQEINPKSMVVNGQKIEYKDCSFISGRIKSEAQLVGGVSAGLGLGTLIFGSAFFSTLKTGGSVALVAGGAAMLVTGVILITKSRKFNLNKGWEVHGGTLVFDRT